MENGGAQFKVASSNVLAVKLASKESEFVCGTVARSLIELSFQIHQLVTTAIVETVSAVTVGIHFGIE